MLTDKKRKDLKMLIEKLVFGSLSEKEGDKLFEKIDSISPDPNWSRYVFHSVEYYDENDNLLIDKVVDKIGEYEPIKL